MRYHERMERKELIRTIYLYLFSLIGLVLITIGLVRLVDLGLKTYVFKNADQVLMHPLYPAVKLPSDSGGQTPSSEERAKLEQDQLEFQKKQRQSDRERAAANSLAMIIVGLPLFIYHWKTVQKDKNP